MSIGPILSGDLVSTARRSGKLDYVVEMDVIRGRYQDACVLAAKVGLVREAYSLSKRHGVTLPHTELTKVVNYMHAQQLCKQTNIKSRWSGKGVTALESQWQKVASSLAMFSQKGKLPVARSTQTAALDEALDGFLTLQVRSILGPNSSVFFFDLTSLDCEVTSKGFPSKTTKRLLGCH